MDRGGGGWSRLSSRPLVEVEPCIHGKYGAHWPFTTLEDDGVGLADEPLQACLGAGLEAK